MFLQQERGRVGSKEGAVSLGRGGGEFTGLLCLKKGRKKNPSKEREQLLEKKRKRGVGESRGKKTEKWPGCGSHTKGEPKKDIFKKKDRQEVLLPTAAKEKRQIRCLVYGVEIKGEGQGVGGALGMR